VSARDDPRVVHVEARVVGDSLDADAAQRAESEAATAAAAEVAVGGSLVDRMGSFCPYLLRVDEAGAFGQPGDGVDPQHRCTAVADPAPLSNRQQTLLCLTSGHRDCPRYVRAQAGVPLEPIGASTHVPRATVAASLVLAASAVVAFGFVLANGGITVPIADAEPSAPRSIASPSAVAILSPSPSPGPSVVSSSEASRSPAPSPSPELSPSPEPSPSPESSPSPSTAPPTPSPTPEPRPTSDRYELLEPCPARPDCWIYTVRAGDNLFSIANYFGVQLETVYQLNPWARTSGIRPGVELILPPPTR
jgi:hypothetical protein